MKLRKPISASPSRGRRGFSILECLVYIGVLFLVVELAFTIFYQSQDSTNAMRRAAEDMTGALRAGENWRQDVRLATGALRAETNGDVEIIHVPRGSGEILYKLEGGNLWRQAATDEPWSQILAGVKSSSMSADQRQHVIAWRWDLELKTRSKSPRLRPLFTFEAVPQPGA